MSKRIVFPVSVLLVCAVLLILRFNHVPPNAVKSTSAPMPVYQGRTAVEWLDQVFTTNEPKAFEAFNEMGSNALPFLVKTFEEENDVKRLDAASVIAVKMPYVKAAVPEFTRLLSERSNGVERGFLLRALLEYIGPGDTNCVPVLIKCLSSQDSSISREFAALSLGRIGPGALAAVPSLTAIFNEPIPGGVMLEDEMHLQMTAARAVWKIDQETNTTSRTLQYVIDHSTNIATRSGALSWLGEMLPGDDSLIEPIIALLPDTNNYNQRALVIRIGFYGPKAKAAVPLLIPLLSGTNIETRAAALESLKKIDPETAAKYENK